MNIIIKRYRLKPETIDGQLYIEGLKVCDTAENAITAIKAGTYPVVIHKCHQHSRKMPILLKPSETDACPELVEGKPFETQCESCEHLACVSNNTTMPTICHQLCPGNGVYHREDGTIILGKYVAPGCLIHPKQAFDTLYERIRKTLERGNEVTLTITEDYPPERHPLVGEPVESITNFELGQQILKHF